MISYVRGELAAIEEQKAIIDVGGVGYGVFMSQQSLSLLPPAGNEVKIYTYLNVKEDALQLFGFLTRDDLDIFRLVIGVSGIGPKGGLNILSCMSPDELRFAIMSGDAKAISAAPGIGKKTAEKLIVELRDKVQIEDVLEHAAHGDENSGAGTVSDAGGGMQAEAVQALVALGYGSAESLRAVKKTSPDCETVEDILKEALKYLF
ncbi:MAG TPA: Holliday junction branch migration protein RuvA [Candidatus Mediterraneibacter vanvlietii]|nr:Holliday junction branch migration protein RuvA [Candidatus Mediterraneibacter vanvlietii]